MDVYKDSFLSIVEYKRERKTNASFYEIYSCDKARFCNHPKHYELKVSKFQNEFIKSSFLPKYEPNIVRISALYCAKLHGRNPYNFGSYFGKNDDFIISF